MPQVCVLGLHTFPSSLQLTQMSPPVPHALGLRPPTQVRPPPWVGSQQPEGQLDGLHPVVTPWHSCALHVVNPSAGQF